MSFTRHCQNAIGGFQQALDAAIRRLSQWLIVVVINQNRPASGGVTAIDVAPAIANHETLPEVDAEFLCCPQQHPRTRLPAIAFGRALARMVTNLDTIQRQCLAHVSMESLHGFLARRPSTDIGLVGCDHEEKACRFELRARLQDTGQNLELFRARWRIRLPVANQSAIDDPIAVEKDGTLEFEIRTSKFGLHFTPSHFVRFTFSLGCETNRCHTTA